jgi:hypothetical protein
MRHAAIFPGLVLAACMRPVAPVTTPSVELEAVQVVEEIKQRRGRAVLPGKWTERGGLQMEILASWRAWEGLAGDSRLIDLAHEESGILIAIDAFPVEPDAPSTPFRKSDECKWLFEDDGRHELLRALRPAHSATCVGHGTDPRVIRGWRSRKNGRDILVYVHYPTGRVIGGARITEPVLSTLSRR